MLNAIFLSDLHLTTLTDQRGQTFLRLMMSFKGPRATASGQPPLSHLFLVGDIFDLWLADHDYFLNTYSPAIDQIRRLKNEGVELHYFEGNHDLYLKKFWGRNLGAKIHPGPTYFQLGPYRLRVEHGDQMDPDDKGYIFLRWLLRTKFMVKLAHNLPSWIVVKLGRYMSRKSRKYTSEVKVISREGAIAKMRKHAETLAQKEPFDLLVHGHVHVHDDYQFNVHNKPRRSINLGSWLGEEQGYLRVTDEEIRFLSAI